MATVRKRSRKSLAPRKEKRGLDASAIALAQARQAAKQSPVPVPAGER